MSTLREDIERIKTKCNEIISYHLQGTSATNTLQCDIMVETGYECGLSDLEKPWIVAMYQESPDDSISVLYEGGSGFMDEISRDDINMLWHIAEWLEENHTVEK